MQGFFHLQSSDILLQIILESGDPHSITIYNELTMQPSGREIALWKYVNVTLHEIGHGLFGFTHDPEGMTGDPSSIMDYRSAYRKGASFNAAQKVIIMESKWGR